MKEFIKKALLKIDLDYADLRFEENKSLKIQLNKDEIEGVNSGLQSGFHLRIFNRGLFNTASFQDQSNIDKIIKESVKIAKSNKTNTDADLQDAPVIKDKVKLSPKLDPRKISQSEKIKILKNYKDFILKNKHIFTVKLIYEEHITNKTYINTEGTEIENELIYVGLTGNIFTKNGNNIQYTSLAFGGGNDLDKISNRESDIDQKIKIAIDLQNARPIEKGFHKVLLNPYLTGVFVHEAFGHFSEADLIEARPNLRHLFRQGNVLGKYFLNIIDDPTPEELPGSYIYDDEGVMGKKTEIVKDGVFCQRLHSRLTANDFSENLTGNMKATSYLHTPIIRMSNIFIAPQDKKFEELLSSIDDGYYLCNARGGETIGDQFSFGAEYGYKIEHGTLKHMVRDINISGNLFKTLNHITAIGNDLKFQEKGGCGKQDQLNLKSGNGGPHIVIEDVCVGGR